MTEFGKIALSFMIGALLMALLIDRCVHKPHGTVIPSDTTSYSAVIPSPNPKSTHPAKPKEVIKVVYRDRWREWNTDTINNNVNDTVKTAICDSLMQFRTYQLKAGSEKVDITADIRVLGYLDSSAIRWKMNIPEVRIPGTKIFIGGFAGQTYGGHVMYQKNKVIYYGSFDNKKELRVGVAFGF